MGLPSAIYTETASPPRGRPTSIKAHKYAINSINCLKLLISAKICYVAPTRRRLVGSIGAANVNAAAGALLTSVSVDLSVCQSS